jgi:hypothetical protein
MPRHTATLLAGLAGTSDVGDALLTQGGDQILTQAGDPLLTQTSASATVSVLLPTITVTEG